MSRYEIFTDRDKKIIQLIADLKVVDVFVVDSILFKNTKTTRVAQRRLQNLYEFNRVKRWRMNQISNYIYYLGKKPINIDHSILMSHFIANLSNIGAEIIEIKREWLIFEGIRIDLFVSFVMNGKNYTSIVEIENTKNFQSKYDKLESYFSGKEYKNLFSNIPLIVCVSDKPFNKRILEVIQIDTKFNNMKELMSI
ncbi:MAG: hypothetical protein ACRDA4_04625 [Filifactoraceae bacterium]